MTTAATPALLIAVVEVATGQTLVVVARCVAIVRVGARFQRIRDAAQPINLTVTEIHRYPGVQTAEIEPPHAARITLTGSGADLIQAGHRIHGVNPAV
jgi:hypothetical protein